AFRCRPRATSRLRCALPSQTSSRLSHLHLPKSALAHLPHAWNGQRLRWPSCLRTLVRRPSRKKSSPCGTDALPWWCAAPGQSLGRWYLHPNPAWCPAPLQPMGQGVPRGQSSTRAGKYLSRDRSEEHTSELQSRFDLVCRLLLEKKKIQRTLPPAKQPTHED